MEKFDITTLHEKFDNIRVTNNHDTTVSYIISAPKGDIGQIHYFKNKTNEIRIFIDNFPGQKKEYSTSIPFYTLEEFVDKMMFLGLELVSEERRTTTNSPIGSSHWYNTLMGRHLHMGETLLDITKLDDIPQELIVSWSQDLYETSKELIRGFKYINK